MNDAALKVYLLAVAALTFNLFFLTLVTAMRRGRVKQFVNPEDARTFKGEQASTDHPSVAKAAAAHRNALESFVPFSVLGLIFVMTGASPRSATIYFATFAAARWAHSICHLLGVQPLRTGVFVVGLLVNIGLAVQVLMAGLR